jgi:hypothetical protein
MMSDDDVLNEPIMINHEMDGVVAGGSKKKKNCE